MTESRKNAIELLLRCIETTHINRNKLSKLAGIDTGTVYNSVNGFTTSERAVDKMKDVLYERLCLQRDAISQELANVNNLIGRLEREELKGLSYRGKQD